MKEPFHLNFTVLSSTNRADCSIRKPPAVCLPQPQTQPSAHRMASDGEPEPLCLFPAESIQYNALRSSDVQRCRQRLQSCHLESLPPADVSPAPLRSYSRLTTALLRRSRSSEQMNRAEHRSYFRSGCIVKFSFQQSSF